MPTMPTPKRQSRGGSGWRRAAPLALLVLVVPLVLVINAAGGVPEGVRGAVLQRGPKHKDRRLAERLPGAAGRDGLHADTERLRAERFATDGLTGAQALQRQASGGGVDDSLGAKLRQEAEERQAAANLRGSASGGAGLASQQQQHHQQQQQQLGQQQGLRGGSSGLGGSKPGDVPLPSGGAGGVAVAAAGVGGAAPRTGGGSSSSGNKRVAAPAASPPAKRTWKWPPQPPSPPPPPPPAADPAPGTYKFVRPRCGDRQDQCPLWKQYGECRGNPGYMYYNCAGSCSVCNVTYLHWDEVGQKRQIAPGVWMPSVGFGTAGLGDYTRDVVVAAIRAGYRGVDSAEAREWYREDLVGQGVWLSGVKREHMFVASKLHPRYHGYWNTLAMHAQTLRDLRTDYLDLFLLHYPECWGSLCGGINPEGTWKDSWAAMEELVHEGSVRAIGVSNFNIAQLMELLTIAKVKPALVQSNSDPLRQDAEVQAFCRLHGIAYQGYSTLGGQWLGQYSGKNPVLLHPIIAEIAARKQRTPAQVVLRWALQHNQLVVPRTTKLNRMTENLQVFDFDLSDADMQKIDGLDGTTPIFPNDAATASNVATWH